MTHILESASLTADLTGRERGRWVDVRGVVCSLEQRLDLGVDVEWPVAF